MFSKAKVVHYHADEARADGRDVIVRVAEDRVGGVHPAEQAVHERKAHAGDECGRDEREVESVGDGRLDAGRVVRAVSLAGDYRETGDQTVGSSEHEEHDGADRADCAQGIGIDEPADDDHVHDVVELLGDVAQKKRHRELEYDRHRVALSHVEVRASCRHKHLP